MKAVVALVACVLGMGVGVALWVVGADKGGDPSLVWRVTGAVMFFYGMLLIGGSFLGLVATLTSIADGRLHGG